MAEKQVFLTYEGLKKIDNELEMLKTKTRKEVAERIKHALEFGDISENAEYDEAKKEQAQLEERIVKLEGILRNAKVIDENAVRTDIVDVGSKVKVKDLEYDEEMEYTIVGSAEADPFEGRISNASPLGQSLLGKKQGDIIDVRVPDGTIQYEILSINK